MLNFYWSKRYEFNAKLPENKSLFLANYYRPKGNVSNSNIARKNELKAIYKRR